MHPQSGAYMQVPHHPFNVQIPPHSNVPTSNAPQMPPYSNATYLSSNVPQSNVTMVTMYQNLHDDFYCQGGYGNPNHPKFSAYFHSIPSPNVKSGSYSSQTPVSESASGASEKSLHGHDGDSEHTSSVKKKTKSQVNNLWYPYHDDVLIPLLAGEVSTGIKPEKNFKKPTYVAAANVVNRQYRTRFTSENVDNHMKALKTCYFNMLNAKEQSGNGWMQETLTLTMEGETYNDFAAANPKLKDYINKPLKWFEELALIVGDDLATWLFCRTAHDAIPTAESETTINILRMTRPMLT